MIIRTDKEGKGMVRELCDMALRIGGVKNLPLVNGILSSVEDLPEEENPGFDKDSNKD